jgi:hypothetical protein
LAGTRLSSASALPSAQLLTTSAAEVAGAAASDLLTALLGAPAEGLAGLRLRARAAIELLLCRLIPVLDAAAILGIVLPLRSIAATATALPLADALRAFVGDVRPVHVPGEIVVLVDIDVHVAATPVAVAPHRRAHGHADAEG